MKNQLLFAVMALCLLIPSLLHASIGADVSGAITTVTVHVSPSGNDSTGNGSSAMPFRSPRPALLAARQLLIDGQHARVLFANGNYSWEGGNVQFGSTATLENWLIIEGQSRTGVVITGQAMTGTEMILIANNKWNFILKKITFTNARKTVLNAGNYSRIRNLKNWLIDDCDFIGIGTDAVPNSQIDAMRLFHVRNLTVRNSRFNDNPHTGLYVLTRDSLIEDVEASRNGQVNRSGSFRGGIAFAANNTVFRRVVAVDNGGPNANIFHGLRGDWHQRDIVIEDCTLNGNSGSGIILEVARGPILITGTEFRDNHRHGIIASTVHDLTIDSCWFEGNLETALRAEAKPRPNASDAGEGDLTRDIGEEWTNPTLVLDFLGPTTIRNSVFIADAPNSLLIAKTPNVGQAPRYREWVTDLMTAHDNHYFHSATTLAFDLGNAHSQHTPGTFEQWRTMVSQGPANPGGNETNSIWALPPANSFLTAQIGSPGAPGVLTESGSTFTLESAGAFTSESSDNFSFAYMSMNGDCTITTRVAATSGLGNRRGAGIMIRDSLVPNTPAVFVGWVPSQTAVWCHTRDTAGTTFGRRGTWSTSTSPWLRIVRTGNQFSLEASTNGTSWVQVGSRTVVMGSNVLVGLAVESGSTNLASGVYESLQMVEQ